MIPNPLQSIGNLSPTIAFLIVSFSLGELGDGLNIFQGIYLVTLGWNEGAVGTALSMMGFTALIVQTFAGDLVDKTRVDRRIFLSAASVLTALSASAIFFVQGNSQHGLMYVSKIVEGVASSFINPCLSALVLATFGPNHFDAVMASNTLWGHVGSVVAAFLAGLVAYGMYPNIRLCFLVIACSALTAVAFVGFLPEGDPKMGRGFLGKRALDRFGHVEQLVDDDDDNDNDNDNDYDNNIPEDEECDDLHHHHHHHGVLEKQPSDCRSVAEPEASSYWDVMSDQRCFLLCLTGFFFHFANANVLLVLGELMGGDNGDDGAPSRAAIPLIAGAIVLAQITMAIATWVGDRLTQIGVGRKPLFMAGLLSLPLRCALIIYWRNAGETYLLSTQILDGLGGGFVGLVHPFLVADITFGTGRFNVVMGLTASCFGLGATLSNFLGQHAVERFGYVASLSGSLVLSGIPIAIFGVFMPETLGCRGATTTTIATNNNGNNNSNSNSNTGLGASSASASVSNTQHHHHHGGGGGEATTTAYVEMS